MQVASIFNAFGSRVQLFQAGPRILTTEDEDVSMAVAAAFRESGMVVRENFGTIESFEKTPDGVRMISPRTARTAHAEAALAVVAVGWVADTAGLGLEAAGVETDPRGYVRRRRVSADLRAPRLRRGRRHRPPDAGPGGGTGRLRSGDQRGARRDAPAWEQVSPIGSFTDPEYAQVGLTEAKARETHDVVVAVVRFDETTRTIIDGRTVGFCKLIADRATGQILGCHVVGERAVEIVQVVAIAIAAGMRVDDLARFRCRSRPTPASSAARRIGPRSSSIWRRADGCTRGSPE